MPRLLRLKSSFLLFFILSFWFMYAQPCVVDAGPDTAICPGGSVQIGSIGIGGYGYSWTPDSSLTSGFLANPVASPSSTTQYILRVTGVGCNSTSVDTVTVSVLQPPPFPRIYNFLLGTRQDSIFKECDGNVSTFTLNLMTDPGSSLNSIPGVIDSFTVDWGDSTIQSGLSAIPSTYTYQTRGLFYLTITAHGTNGCASSQTFTVVFQSTPGGGISVPPNTEGCLPAQLSFTLQGDSLDPPGTSYIWDFGDSSQNVVWPYSYPQTVSKTVFHTYTMTSCGQPNDEFIVTVRSTNECGTRTTTSDQIKIFQAPVADFDLSPSIGCTDSTDFCFTNTSVLGRDFNCNSTTIYTWDFGDGTTQMTFSTVNNGDACHTYSQPGNYTVTLSAYNRSRCDTSTISKSLRVNTPPIADIVASDSTGCVPFTVSFDGSASTGGQLSYRWEVLPSTGWNYVPPFHADSVVTRITFNDPDIYEVSLIVQNNCGTDTTVFTVRIGGDATIDLAPILPGICDSFIYNPVLTIDTAFGSLDSIFWSFPGGTPSSSNLLSPGPIFYNSPGFYTVTVSTVTSCDSISISRSFLINESPTADFVADTVCQGFETAFWDSSRSGNTAINSWFWDFDDGFTSTQANPRHRFAACGSYMVTLIVEDMAGCNDTIILPVLVRCLPNIGFLADTVCLGFPTTFTDTSSGNNGVGIQNWTWFFPGGNVTGKDPMYAFDTCGTRRVSLLVSDSLGCSNATTRNVYVYCPPEANFQVAPVCAGFLTSFTDNSFAGDAPINQWNWTFGDAFGGSSILQHPSYLYDTCGFYTGELIVTDDNACRDTSIQQVEIYCPPQALFQADTVCEGQPTRFQNLSTNGAGTIQRWRWFFGDGDSAVFATPVNPNHLYSNCGLYTTTLITVDDNACQDTFQLQVFVRCLPLVIFSAPTTCLRDSTYFTDLSISSNGPLTQWTWNFGDNSMGAMVQNPVHLYMNHGLYQVNLAVVDSFGCTQTDRQMVEVWPLPDVDVVDTLIQLCSQSILDTLSRYILISSDAGVWNGPQLIGNLWTSRSDSMLGAFDPSLLQTNTVYTFTYTATNSFGCQESDSLRITVINAQSADAGPDSILCFASGSYNLQQFASPGGGLWRTHGPGLLANGVFDVNNVVPGNYSFYYSIGSGTCLVIDTVQITVNPQVVANAGQDGLFCFGDSIQIGGNPSGTGGTSPYQFSWEPAVGVNNLNLANPWVKGINGTISYILTVTDSVNCIARDTVLITENPQLTVDAGPRDSICYGDSTILQAQASGGSGIYTYNWSPASMLINPTSMNPTTQNLTASQLFVVEITDSAGCTALDSVFIWVNPAISVQITGDSFVCYEACAALRATPMGGSGGYSYVWNPSLALSSLTDSAVQACGLQGNQAYQVVLTDSLGCQASDVLSITVNPQLRANASIGGGVCFNDTIRLNGIGFGGSPTYTYLWTPNDSLSSDTIANPLVDGLQTTTQYMLTITDSRGCQDTSSVWVQVNDEIVVDAGFDQFVCYEAPGQLSANVNGGSLPYSSIQWNPSSNLSSANVLSPSFVGLQDTQIYVLTITDQVGCPDSDTVIVFVTPEIQVRPGEDTLFCYRDSVVLGATPTASGGTGGLTYQWMPGIGLSDPMSPNPVVFQLDSQLVYQVFVTDSLNCVDSALVWVGENPEIIVDAGAGDSLCYLDQTNLQAIVSGGSRPYILQWQPANLVQSPNSPTSLTFPLSSTTSFYLELTDSAACQVVDSTLIIVNPALDAQAGPNQFICFEDTTQLNGSASGGTVGYQYSWTPVANLEPGGDTLANPLVIGLSQTTTFRLVVTDVVGCTDTAFITITVNPELIANAGGDDAICFSAPTSLNGSATGGTPAYSYLWAPTANVSPPNIANPRIIGLGSTRDFYLTVTDAVGCTDQDSTRILVNPPIQIQLSGDTVCYEEDGQLFRDCPKTPF